MLKNVCSRFFWAVLAVLLCAAPIFAYYIAYGEDDIYADTPLISDGLLAMPDSIVNIYAGAIGGTGITVSPGADVTVHGTDFALENVSETAAFDDPDNPTQIIPEEGWSGVLTGTYGEEYGGGPINLFFHSDDPINLVNTGSPGPEPITIDIKPGSYPNAINLGSNGVVPIAILSTIDFNATELDPDTVFLEGLGVAVRGKGNKSLAHQEDVNGDGLMDLVVKVETENLDPDTFQDGYGTVQVIVNGTLIYEGSDEITIVPPE